LYRADFDKLNGLLSSVEWDEALMDLDINSAWRYFSSKFDSFVKECVPMSIPINKKNLYINREAKSLKNKRTVYGKDISDHNFSQITDPILKLVMLCEHWLEIFANNLRDRLPTTSKLILKHFGIMHETEWRHVHQLEVLKELIVIFFFTSDKDKSNAFNKIFSSVFTAENPSTASNFHVNKNDQYMYILL